MDVTTIRRGRGAPMIAASGFCGVMRPDAPLRDQIRLTPVPLQSTPDGVMWCGAWRHPRAMGVTAAARAGVAAFHGEIFNRLELAHDLGLDDHAAVLDLLEIGFQRWALGLFERAEGVYALAVRDRDDLILFRDRSAMSSLYVQRGAGGQLAFATHLDTLLRLPGTRRALSRRSLHEFLRFLDIAAPHTIYADVVAVEPGQVLRWTRDRLVGEPLASIAGEDAIGDLQTAVDRLETALDGAVRRHLQGARRPAAFLSGGIDSSLICASGATACPDLTAVTVGFEQPDLDEATVAVRIARHLGIRHEVMQFGQAECVAGFERLTRHMDQPMADPATPVTLLAFEACRDRFDVILDGTGADEGVGMMPPRYIRLATEYSSLLPNAARAALTKVLTRTPRLSAYARLFDFGHPAETMIRWKGFTRTEIAAMCGDEVSFEETRFYKTYAMHPRQAHFERYSALLDAMPCDRLVQAMLISGLGVRFPFLDASVDRFLRQLPIDFRYRPGQPKRILRELLARRVPRELWDRPKHGFDFPLHGFLSANRFGVVKRYLNRDAWRHSGVLSPEDVAVCAQRFIAGDRTLTFRVWALAVLGAWLEHHQFSR